MKPPDRSLVDVSTAEIKAQQIVYLFIVFPIAGLFFPAITLYWIIYAFLEIAVQFGWLKEQVHTYILGAWPQVILIGIALTILFDVVWIMKSLKSTNSKPEERRLKAVPDIEKGKRLIAFVTRIWEGMEEKVLVPEVLWFVNFNVLARLLNITTTNYSGKQWFVGQNCPG